MIEDFLSISGKIFAISAIRYFIVAGIPFLLFYKLVNGKVINAKIQNKNAAKKDYIREILHSLQSTAVMAIIAYLVLFTPLRSHTLAYRNIAEYGAWFILPAVLASLIIHDTYFYWMHRILHHPGIFNYTHLVHHKSVNPTPWASYSFHFFEAITEGAVLLIIVVTVPMHPISIGLFVLVGFMINVYGHLGYEVMPKGFRNSIWFNLLNTSVYHNLHHSKFKGNYGLYFRFWDKLMGTENPEYVDVYDRIQEKRFKSGDVEMANPPLASQ